jgi:hypothetical protein
LLGSKPSETKRAKLVQVGERHRRRSIWVYCERCNDSPESQGGWLIVPVWNDDGPPTTRACYCDCAAGQALASGHAKNPELPPIPFFADLWERWTNEPGGAPVPKDATQEDLDSWYHRLRERWQKRSEEGA